MDRHGPTHLPSALSSIDLPCLSIALPTMFSVTRVPSVRVVHIDHPEYGENGKYFFFDGAEWSAMVGATSSSNWTSSILHVYQFRDGKFMWQGEVKVWDNDNGIHGRREPSSKAKSNQWQTGDIITVQRMGAVNDTVTDGSSEQSAIQAWALRDA